MRLPGAGNCNGSSGGRNKKHAGTGLLVLEEAGPGQSKRKDREDGTRHSRRRGRVLRAQEGTAESRRRRVFSRVHREQEVSLQGECTAPSDENDYTDCSSYLTEDGLAGFSVTGTGWLVSLYSNYNERGFARAVRDHIVRDAYKLVCIVSSEEDGSGLVRMYEDLEYNDRQCRSLYIITYQTVVAAVQLSVLATGLISTRPVPR